MRQIGLLLIAVTVAFASSTSAENRLIPTRSHSPDVCPDQPPEPDWMKEMGPRKAHQRLLIQQIYRAMSMQRIVASQECECATRFPSWAVAETEFRKRFATAEYREIVNATEDFRRLANELRVDAMPICKAAENW